MKSRIVNKEILSQLRGSPCTICGHPGVAHHVRSVGAGGDDVVENLMVLCQKHHVEVHTRGLTEFAAKYVNVTAWLKKYNWTWDSFMERWTRITPDGWEE